MNHYKIIMTTSLLALAAMCIMLLALWEGVNQDLCDRQLPPEKYKEMELDCTDYGY